MPRKRTCMFVFEGSGSSGEGSRSLKNKCVCLDNEHVCLENECVCSFSRVVVNMAVVSTDIQKNNIGRTYCNPLLSSLSYLLGADVLCRRQVDSTERVTFWSCVHSCPRLASQQMVSRLEMGVNGSELSR